jgi:signal transduction histidine kinase
MRLAFTAAKDHGIGIAPEYLERIFQPRERLNRREEYVGAGLGPAACQKAPEKIGANFRAESEPGAGALFRIRLPAPRIGKTDSARRRASRQRRAFRTSSATR